MDWDMKKDGVFDVRVLLPLRRFGDTRDRATALLQYVLLSLCLFVELFIGQIVRASASSLQHT